MPKSLGFSALKWYQTCMGTLTVEVGVILINITLIVALLEESSMKKVDFGATTTRLNSGIKFPLSYR